jgi:hypothetical protein
LPAKEGGAGVTEAAKEGCGARQARQDEEAQAEEKDRAREVASPRLGRPSTAVALSSQRAERAPAFIDRDAERPQSVTTIAIVPELLPRLERWLDDRLTVAALAEVREESFDKDR